MCSNFIKHNSSARVNNTDILLVMSLLEEQQSY